MAGNRKKKKNSPSGFAVFTEFLLSLAIIGGGVYAVGNAVSKSSIVKNVRGQDSNLDSTEDIQQDSTENNIYDGYSFSTVSYNDIFSGDLVLVNDEYEHHQNNENQLVGIMDRVDENSGDSEEESEHKIMITALQPLSDFMNDFQETTGIDNVVIYTSYRTQEVQQELYDNFVAEGGDESDSSNSVAKAGHSEHQTGYAVDFTTLPDYEFEGDGDYVWFSQNCQNYGFILRYPEGKYDITNIKHEPWHFRYVGIPHATYIMQNNICLEEYIDLLRERYSFDSDHLIINGSDGLTYEVYYWLADSSSETISIPVPTDYEYTISGNNIDGFIVTICTDGFPKYSSNSSNTPVETETETETETEEQESQESEESEENQESEESENSEEGEESDENQDSEESQEDENSIE